MMTRLLGCLLILMLAVTTHAQHNRVAVPLGDSPALGPADAAVTIVEFIDFQ